MSLVDGVREPGNHAVRWDGRVGGGDPLASGMNMSVACQEPEDPRPACLSAIRRIPPARCQL